MLCAADDVVEAELAFELRLELGVLFAQPLLVEPGVQHARELRQLERLDQEVDGAALDRRDRFRDAAEAGHDDRADLRVALERLVEHLSCRRRRAGAGRRRGRRRQRTASRSMASAASAACAAAKPLASRLATMV